MNQQNLSLQSSQNDVLSEQPFQESQNSQETLTNYHVEYFCVFDTESTYHSPLFATKVQNDAVLLHILQAFPKAHGECRKSYFRSEQDAGRQELLSEIMGAGPEYDQLLELLRQRFAPDVPIQLNQIGEGV
ncbi:hypothetical protein QZJ86_04195 [Methylomonas montana]|uniref:hypothetical protein n=1 Tax=Methylomonas montana TaxID=3058963 RepID=UPI002659695D|nr:hypothetical protein [Methylomonas montana]WKJ91336.1 hypothetical protein QZJ86_04195 [Methylomonas montana]